MGGGPPPPAPREAVARARRTEVRLRDRVPVVRVARRMCRIGDRGEVALNPLPPYVKAKHYNEHSPRSEGCLHTPYASALIL